jgi:hypothetical protein
MSAGLHLGEVNLTPEAAALVYSRLSISGSRLDHRLMLILDLSDWN